MYYELCYNSMKGCPIDRMVIYTFRLKYGSDIIATKIPSNEFEYDVVVEDDEINIVCYNHSDFVHYLNFIEFTKDKYCRGWWSEIEYIEADGKLISAVGEEYQIVWKRGIENEID